MTILDLSPEISFQTSRSSGRGGQHVNKVETAVTGYFNIMASQILSEEQKLLVAEKLLHRINRDGLLMVKSQTHRTQLANKEEVIKKMNELVARALLKKKKRIATQVSRAAREKRLELKKRKSEIKSARKKFKPGDLNDSR